MRYFNERVEMVEQKEKQEFYLFNTLLEAIIPVR